MKLILSLLLNVLALIITTQIVPGFSVDGFTSAILAAIILGVVNTFVKPILLFITLPLNVVTLGLFTFVVNAVVLLITDWIVPGLVIDGLMSAILAAIVLSVVSTGLSMVVGDFAGLGVGKKRK